MHDAAGKAPSLPSMRGRSTGLVIEILGGELVDGIE